MRMRIPSSRDPCLGVHSFTVVCQLGKCPTRGAGAGGGGATSRLWPEVGLNTVITRRTLRENGDTVSCFSGVCRRLMKGAAWRQNSCVTVVSKFMGITVNQ